jgi:hypothetical protein
MASVMPSGVPETFTGADGSVPAQVTQALNEGSGGGISVQGNQLRVRTGGTTGNRTSVRLTGVSKTDVEMVFTWTVNSGLYGQAMLRSANASLDTGNTYQFSLVPNDMTLVRRSPGYSGPALVTATHGFTNGQVVRTRVAVFGQVLYARTWLAVDPEPTSVWQIIYTDTGGITATGSLGISASSASTGSKDLFVDDLDAKDVLTPTQATLFAAGSVGLAGTETSIVRKAFSAALASAGAFTKSRAVVRAFSGALSTAGAMKRGLGRTFGGVLAPAGAKRAVAGKKFASAITPTAAIRRSPVKRLAGTVAPAGLGVVLFVGRIFGRPGIVVMKLVQKASVRIRQRKG